MHVEISRIGHDEDMDAIAAELQRVLRDVRESVEDWERMRLQVRDVIGDLRKNPPVSVSATELERSVAFLEWLADEHFTFLGYREYHLAHESAGEFLTAVPGTGYGILRNDPDMSAGVGRLPEAVAAKAREHTLLVLAKANSRSTVHRPAYLDYVGVKTFGPDGEVSGERRFLGLFSSAAYTESVWHVPLLREKAKDVLQTLGLDPHSHAGKALIDTLETYPRDELFHTPVDELATMASRVMETRGRRQLRIFVRRDTYGRYVSVLVFLPRDRYNTAVRERFSSILKDSFAGEQVEFTVRMSESTTARVHFVVHPARGQAIPDVDVSELERRLTEASRSWRDDFADGRDLGVRRGCRLAAGAHLRGVVPRGLQGGLLRGHRRPRPRAPRGARRAWHRPVAVLPARRGPGRARLKVFRRGSAISLSQVLPVLSSMGVEVVDERPYELDHDGTRRTSTTSGCATPPACPTRCASPSRTRSGRSGTATTRSTASTRWCSARASPGGRPRCCVPTPST